MTTERNSIWRRAACCDPGDASPNVYAGQHPGYAQQSLRHPQAPRSLGYPRTHMSVPYMPTIPQAPAGIYSTAGLGSTNPATQFIPSRRSAERTPAQTRPASFPAIPAHAPFLAGHHNQAGFLPTGSGTYPLQPRRSADISTVYPTSNVQPVFGTGNALPSMAHTAPPQRQTQQPSMTGLQPPPPVSRSISPEPATVAIPPQARITNTKAAEPANTNLNKPVWSRRFGLGKGTAPQSAPSAVANKSRTAKDSLGARGRSKEPRNLESNRPADLRDDGETGADNLGNASANLQSTRQNLPAKKAQTAKRSLWSPRPTKQRETTHTTSTSRADGQNAGGIDAVEGETASENMQHTGLKSWKASKPKTASRSVVPKQASREPKSWPSTRTGNNRLEKASEPSNAETDGEDVTHAKLQPSGRTGNAQQNKEGAAAGNVSSDASHQGRKDGGMVSMVTIQGSGPNAGVATKSGGMKTAPTVATGTSLTPSGAGTGAVTQVRQGRQT